jgi:hypothetical protein
MSRRLRNQAADAARFEVIIDRQPDGLYATAGGWHGTTSGAFCCSITLAAAVFVGIKAPFFRQGRVDVFASAAKQAFNGRSEIALPCISKNALSSCRSR